MDVRQERNPLAGLSEEGIAALAQQGSDSAFAFLLERYRECVKIKSKSYFLVGGDWEDVVQEGMIGLFKAVRSFDPEKNASFKTFAELCITRHIISAVKSATRQKHMPLNYYVSLSGGEDCDFYEASVKRKDVNPEQIVIDKEAFSGMEFRIDKALSSFEAEVLSYHLNGLGYGEIAKLLGRPAKSVDNALQRIKKKLEAVLCARQ